MGLTIRSLLAKMATLRCVVFFGCIKRSGPSSNGCSRECFLELGLARRSLHDDVTTMCIG